MKKYALVSGCIISKNDNQRHFIGFRQLLECYKLKRNECYFINKELELRFLPDYIIPLFPREKGDYKEYLEYINR